MCVGGLGLKVRIEKVTYSLHFSSFFALTN